MSKISLIKTSFNGGQLSEKLAGRVDLDKYANGCKTLQNFIPMTQGPIMKRPGTEFIAATKNNGKVWLAKFEFTFQQAFVLEFGDQYIRFYFNESQVLVNNVPYEIPTPYQFADLTTSEGTFALSMVQSGDVIYIAHRKYKTQKLSRLGNTNWVLQDLVFVNGPFVDENKDPTKNIAIAVSSGQIGAHVDIDASVPLFDSSMIGELFEIELLNNPSKQWQQLTKVAVGDIVTNDNKFYQAIEVLTDSTQYSGTTGYIAPIHTRGSKFDGQYVKWQFLSSKVGIVRITSVIDSQNATGVAVQPFPYGYTTSYWARSSFGITNGYAEQVAFFRERLVFTRDQKVWFSVAGDYENFAAREFGEVLTDSAISIDLTSEDDSPIKTLTNTPQGLICGTNSDHVLITNASISQPFGPDNIRVSPGSGIGTRQINPVKIDQSILMIQRTGTKLLNLQFDDSVELFITSDLTVIADQILAQGVVDMVWQRDPWMILWLVRADGILIGFTYNQEQQVQCFHTHFTEGVVETIQCIPSPDGSRDDIWLSIKRVINGNTVRYIELLKKEYNTGGNSQLLWYSDCARMYQGMATKIISGLNHLIGATVQVIANGAYHPNVIVGNTGSVTLNYSATNAIIGLPFTCIMETMKLEGGANDGTSQGKMKRINRVILRLLNSMGEIECAPSANGNQNGKFDKIIFNNTYNRLDIPAPIFTGDKILDLSSEYNRSGIICIKQHQSFPITLIAIMPDMTTYER